MTLAVFTLALLASCRLTRLITEDTITAFFREFLARRVASSMQRLIDGREKPAIRRHYWAHSLWVKAEEWSGCPWCAGFWVAAAVTALAAASGGAHWFLYPAVALSISYLLGVIATVLYTIEEL